MMIGLWIAFALLALNAGLKLVSAAKDPDVAGGLVQQISALVFAWAAYSVWSVIP